MGMSTHIVLRRNLKTDEDYQKHLNVIKICKYANVSIPKETLAYFNWNHSYEPEMEEIIEEFELIEGFSLDSNLTKNDYVVRWGDEGRDGFEINIEELPKDCKFIRFYNSY